MIPPRLGARELLALIGAELALAVLVALHPPRLLRPDVADQDCVSVREGLALQTGAMLDARLKQGPVDPALSPAVSALRGTGMLWAKVPASPASSGRPAFQLVESTDYVPVRSSECTAFVLADPRPNGTAIVIRQFVRGELAEFAVQPGQRIIPGT